MINGIWCNSVHQKVRAGCTASKNRLADSIPALAASLLLPFAIALPIEVSAATKVAIIADTGARTGFSSVLNLIQDEGAELVLIQGDFGYDDNEANTWEESINAILGPDFPVLGVVGNHEDFEWPLYQNFLEQRIERIGGLNCDGDVGVKAHCTFGNVRVVQVAPGIREVAGIVPQDSYDRYIRSVFSNNNDETWKICAWHKNQTAMQVYRKGNSTGWAVYDACLDMGALVVSGHAHTYSRTHLMDDFRTQSVVDRDSDFVLEPGRSLAIVSGLGGRDARPQLGGGDGFASVYTATQNAAPGALFCTFDTDTADCYFKAVNGALPDEFRLVRRNRELFPTGPMPNPDPEPMPDSDPMSEPDPIPSGFVFSRTDKVEFRWIETDSSGQLGSIWIDQSCVARLGGASDSGDWFELLRIAPGFDTVPNPCVAAGLPGPGDPPGYVFERSDKDELRWIGTDPSGGLGSIWIDQACADSLGESVANTGDWFDLLEAAPGFDTIASPCY